MPTITLMLLSIAALPLRAETLPQHAKHAAAKVIRDPTIEANDGGAMEYVIGQSIFERIWVSAPSSTEAADGLGPLFNARSCVACHPGGGRPLVLLDEQGIHPGLLARLGLADGATDPVYGSQLQTDSVAGVPAEGRLHIEFDKSDVLLADGNVVELRRPIASVLDLGYGAMSPETLFGLRFAPAIHGIGPLDRVASADIAGAADPDDADGDGISGRVAWLDVDQTVLGRFGWKAVQPNLNAQNAHAFMGDLGLSTANFPDPHGECTMAEAACREAPSGASPQYEDLEVSPILMAVLDRFVAEAVLPNGSPAPDAAPAVRDRGRVLFTEAGCQACHRQSYEIVWPVDATATRRISPYTDLLLHDMGDGLAEDLPEGAATGREWRTAPLWGLRRSLDAAGQGALLHDGRARSILEAILWHGGEAQAARDHVGGLPAEDRAALISFLSSL
ncbi:MAG: hypothetical protein JNL25_10365 [Rhodospirillaceae bacterium]|nr:hypothetical protein [Rhodospirillaceae bacterium]